MKRYRIALRAGFLGLRDGAPAMVDHWSRAVEVTDLREAEDLRRQTERIWPGTRPRIEQVPPR